MLNMELKKFIALLACIIFSLNLFSQDNKTLLRDAQQLELKFDEPAALEKYKQIAANDASNIAALVKCAELNCSIGARQKDDKVKSQYYTSAQDFAQQAYIKDSANADACYAKALVALKFALTEDENKKLAGYIKQIKIYSDRSLSINANQAKANYVMGKWHF